MGGAVTYLQNVLPELLQQLNGHLDPPVIIWGGEEKPVKLRYYGQAEFRQHRAAAQGGLRRLMFDQFELPIMLRRERQDVLFSSANFGPLRCPCRHILLVRNTLPFSETYYSRMTQGSVRRQLRVQRWLTLQAISRADHILFPSRAMLEMVAGYRGGVCNNWSVAYYGIARDLFSPATPQTQGNKLDGVVRLLHVSLYCDQKNVGTLLQAMRVLHERQPRRFHLTLTANFDSFRAQDNPHCPALRQDRSLFRELASQGIVEDLGTVPYRQLPEYYRQADIFLFPSYTESFGHPLVESMASGLPIVASDVPVNREICGDAALYFDVFDSDALAGLILSLSGDESKLSDLRMRSLARSANFMWTKHVAELVRTVKMSA